MTDPDIRTQLNEATAFVQARARRRPTVGLITGSGLAGLAEQVEDPVRIGFSEIPHFPRSTVEGHPGQLVMGRLESKPVIMMQGRVHFYEGFPIQQITLPVRVMQLMGVETLIVTNAAGGLNPNFQAGDLMLITDHINFVGMAGFNPLHGPNDPELGPRFPLMAGAYDSGLRRLARQVAQELGIELKEGVYIMLAGPTFETPAELRFLRLIGADAVGMSTVPEVVVARHGGIRVLGISHISNMALPDQEEAEPPTVAEVHGEVLAAGEAALPRLTALIRGVLRKI